MTQPQGFAITPEVLDDMDNRLVPGLASLLSEYSTLCEVHPALMCVALARVIGMTIGVQSAEGWRDDCVETMQMMIAHAAKQGSGDGMRPVWTPPAAH